jgi:hypothetical protein
LAGLIHRAFSSGRVNLDSQYLVIIGVTLALVAFLVLAVRAHAARQDASDGKPGQGDGHLARHSRRRDLYSAVLGGIARILVAPVLFVSIQMRPTIALKAFAATIIGGFDDVAGAILDGTSSLSWRSSSSSSCARKASSVSESLKRLEKGHSAIGQFACALFAATLVVLAATVKTDG